MFKGTAASPGIVLGKALVLEHNELVIEKKSISDVDKEIERLNDAVAISKAELEKAMANLQTVKAPVNNGDTTVSVKTGDESLVGMFAGIALLSVAGYALLRRKED